MLNIVKGNNIFEEADTVRKDNNEHKDDSNSRWGKWIVFYARIALGATFLNGIASRFGLYSKGVGYGNFSNFLDYTAQVNSFMPAFMIPILGWAETVCESVLGALLIIGFWPRFTTFAPSILLALFGIAMAISFGIISPLNYSVFSASACSLLLSFYYEDNTQKNELIK